jgi:hypothetical protein
VSFDLRNVPNFVKQCNIDFKTEFIDGRSFISSVILLMIVFCITSLLTHWCSRTEKSQRLRKADVN